jgi:hypothetical protein
MFIDFWSLWVVASASASFYLYYGLDLYKNSKKSPAMLEPVGTVISV